MEKHHIVPKSEGGTNEEANLINLTAREHYVAHLLLAKIYDDRKMWAAVNCMTSKHFGNRDFRFSSHLYEIARKHFSQYSGELRRGKPSPTKGRAMSKEQKRLISETKKRRTHYLNINPMSQEHKQHISEHFHRTKWWNNGVVNVRSTDCPEGFVRGRLLFGRSWYNNGTIEVYRIDCPEGFVRGRLLPSLESRRKMSEAHKRRNKE